MAQGQIKKPKAGAPKLCVTDPQIIQQIHAHIVQYPTQTDWRKNHQAQKERFDQEGTDEEGTLSTLSVSSAALIVFSQKHSAGLTAVTEKSLAGKAGHLEMLHGGKKDRLKEIAAKKAKAGK